MNLAGCKKPTQLMPPTNKKVNHSLKLEWAIVLIITIVSAIFSINCIHPGHDWGGDFSLYLAQAKAILDGSVFQLFEENKFMVQNSSRFAGPYLYPFGFPYLLTTIYNLVSLDFVALKLFCTSFFLMSIPLIYLLFRSGLSNKLIAALATTAIAFHPIYLQFSDGVQADLPYLFFSLLALVMINRLSLNWNQFALGVVIFMAYWIRDIGIFLVPALFIAQIQRYHNNWRSFSLKQGLLLSSPYLIFILFFVLNYLLLPQGGANHIDYLFNRISAEGMFNNFDYYLTMGLSYLRLPRNWPLLLSITFLTVTGMLTVSGKQSFLIVYFLLVGILLICWPSFRDMRYLIPILPLYLYFLIQGVVFIGQRLRIERWSYALLTLLIIFFSYLGLNQTSRYFHIDSNQAFTPEMQKIYDFLRQNVESNEVIAFEKPRVLRFFTDKRTIVTDLSNFDSSKANYLLLAKSANNKLKDSIAFESENYVLIVKE